MRGRAGLAVLAIAAGVSLAVAGDPPRRGGDVQEARRRAVEGLLAALERDGFSGSVLIAKDGEILLERGYGQADRTAGTPNGPDTLFDIGSVSKSFTATAVARLQSSGLLNVSDRIGKHLNGVPIDKAAITVRHLLSHTSGLPRMYSFAPEQLATRDGMVAAALATPLVAPPGSRFEYTNAGYFLLAAIVECVSGIPFEAVLHREVFAPAGLRDTGVCGDAALDAERSAKRYEEGREVGSMLAWGYGWGHRGATGVVTTVRDLYRWDRALRGGEVLSVDAKALLFTPGPDGYGCGWFVRQTPRGSLWIYHEGAAPGAQAVFHRYAGQGEDAVVIVLSNCFDGMATRVAREVGAVLFEGR